MSEKFSGTQNELETATANLGCRGEWKDCGDKKQFRGQDGGALDLFRTGTLQFQGKNQNEFEKRLLPWLRERKSVPAAPPAAASNIAPAAMPGKKIFVVHGHDSAARDQLELILMKHSSIGIVLLTPDDFVYSQGEKEADKKPRARQNVILEMGMVMARLGRDKTLILKKGALELPSDIAGLQYHEFNDHVKEIVPKLVQRLNDLGFMVSADRITAASA